MMLALIAEALVYRVADAMGALAPLAALTLAAVFALAAVTKLVDRAATTTEFDALGLPAPAAFSRIVPPAEFAVAGLLLLRPAVGALLAAIALLAFSAVLVSVLRSGRSVSCGCLGPLSRRPVSGSTLARNGFLLTLAALASIGPNPGGPVPVLPAIDVTMAAGTSVLLAALGYQLLALRNQIGRLWSVDLAGEQTSPNGPINRRRTKQAHAERAVMNGAAS